MSLYFVDSDDEDISVPAPPPPRIKPRDVYKERPPAPLPEEESKPFVPPRQIQAKGDTANKPAKGNTEWKSHDLAAINN